MVFAKQKFWVTQIVIAVDSSSFSLSSNRYRCHSIEK